MATPLSPDYQATSSRSSTAATEHTPPANDTASPANSHDHVYLHFYNGLLKAHVNTQDPNYLQRLQRAFLRGMRNVRKPVAGRPACPFSFTTYRYYISMLSLINSQIKRVHRQDHKDEEHHDQNEQKKQRTQTQQHTKPPEEAKVVFGRFTGNPECLRAIRRKVLQVMEKTAKRLCTRRHPSHKQRLNDALGYLFSLLSLINRQVRRVELELEKNPGSGWKRQTASRDPAAVRFYRGLLEAHANIHDLSYLSHMKSFMERLIKSPDINSMTASTNGSRAFNRKIVVGRYYSCFTIISLINDQIKLVKLQTESNRQQGEELPLERNQEQLQQTPTSDLADIILGIHTRKLKVLRDIRSRIIKRLRDVHEKVASDARMQPPVDCQFEKIASRHKRFWFSTLSLLNRQIRRVELQIEN